MSVPNFERILVATDFSEPARHARDVALLIARKFDATLIVLHVYQPPIPAYETPFTWPIEELESYAQDALDAELAQVRQHYPRVEGLVRPGYPPREIVQAAKQLAADLIVIGTHGRRGLPRMLLGSVAEKVSRTAPVPVLTVAPSESVVARDLPLHAAGQS